MKTTSAFHCNPVSIVATLLIGILLASCGTARRVDRRDDRRDVRDVRQDNRVDRVSGNY